MSDDLMNARMRRTEELFLLCHSEQGRDELLMIWLESKRQQAGMDVAPPEEMNWSALAKEVIEMEFGKTD